MKKYLYLFYIINSLLLSLQLKSQLNLNWAMSIGNSGGDDQGYLIVVDSQRNTYVSGSISGPADFDPSFNVDNLTPTGGQNTFIAKYDSSGNYLWARSLRANISHLKIDSSNNLYVVGSFSTTIDLDFSSNVDTLVPVSTDIFIAKYDPSANYIWGKQIKGACSHNFSSFVFDNSGDIYIAGNFHCSVDLDPSSNTFNLTTLGAGSVFIAKYDASFNFLWAKQIGGNPSVSSLALEPINNNICVTGRYNSTTDFDPAGSGAYLYLIGGSCTYIAKYDSSGNYLWAQRMAPNYDSNPNSICVDSLGNAYLAGVGTQQQIGQPSNLYIYKFDAAGNNTWGKIINGATGVTTIGVNFISNNNVYVSGLMYGTADLDFGSGNFTVSNPGGHFLKN